MHQRLDVQLVDGPLLDLVVVAAVRLVRFVGLAIAELAQLASKFLALFGRHRTGRLARPSSFGGLDGPPDPPASARRGGMDLLRSMDRSADHADGRKAASDLRVLFGGASSRSAISRQPSGSQ